MRVAFVGKGGAGKSSIAGTFARLLARAGQPVLALDSDPLPGLPYALGIPVDDNPIPDDAVIEGPNDGPRYVLAPGLDPETVIARFGKLCPDGVRYLQFGNTSGHIATLQRAQFAWSETVAGVAVDKWHLVGDLPGGTRQAMFGWAKYANHVLIVVEPTAKSLHSARRLLNMSEADWAPTSISVIANKVRDEADIGRISDRLGRPVVATVPWSPAVLGGDKLAQAPLDAEPDGEFVRAVALLVDELALEYGHPPGRHQ